jgi:hypothetical protein
MLKDTQLTTVMLLVALGLLIYYLTRPKTEGFAEDETQQAEQAPVQSIQTNAVPEQKPEEQQTAELAKSIMAEAEQADVFQFEGNEQNELDGAQLADAFERPIAPEARPDEVDINKNNVDNYNAKDFLPNEINNQWFDTDFSQAKYNINDDKLINTDRYVIGINTVGQSLKNASYDIRGTIPNPKFSVSPWNNSTYTADYNIKPLC